jgi:hypothetical protein
MNSQDGLVSSRKVVLMLAITVLACVGIFFVPAIQQDPAYHLFVDHRHLLGVDNFWNVMSNLPFVTLGLSGLALTYFSKRFGLGEVGREKATPLFTVFFTGILLTGFGSGYYHYNPNNLTLVWDRLPMTISFMAFFCMVIGYHLNMDLAKRLLKPLLVLGLGSVAYWIGTEFEGKGDLRPYVLVQFLPLVLVPILISRSGADFLKAKSIWLVIGYYATAKACEHWDGALYEQFLVISGHSIKHVIAALGAYVVYLHFKRDLIADWKALRNSKAEANIIRTEQP